MTKIIKIHSLATLTECFICFQLDEATLGLSRQLLIGGLNDSLTKAYYDYMVDMAVIFGAEKSRAETELRESLNFEISLANVSASILDISMI